MEVYLHKCAGEVLGENHCVVGSGVARNLIKGVLPGV